jgi:hypothetical protein
MFGIIEAFANQIDKTKRFLLSTQWCDYVPRQNEVCTTPGELIINILIVTFMPALSGLFFAR